MTDPTGPPAADYPAPPWKARGVLWMSVLTAREAPELPADLSPVGGRRTLLLVLARYTEGSLRYDEFAVGSPARRGRRVGMFCHRIWVDSAASLRGGRQLWGIPKEMARFSWDAETVRVPREAGRSRPSAWARTAGRASRSSAPPAAGSAGSAANGRSCAGRSRGASAGAGSASWTGTRPCRTSRPRHPA
ncbi:acetoacetate decarboxylase family protein [Streptomyces purpurogeneiscleroticus]|uniref:acetoacetate decarboxylase family protein n=1 Tax=Streptomyces purpurogeneiscleroticus TaxID=68259 RepID=UPI001CBD3F57|nr:acetoacetate decarboxylase family protein [Streptomyces purpurogeneiscleroticus]MBZ4018841.1 hypothetical protein [Streptomyces purpurogeneiscleroticus]